MMIYAAIIHTRCTAGVHLSGYASQRYNFESDGESAQLANRMPLS